MARGGDGFRKVTLDAWGAFAPEYRPDGRRANQKFSKKSKDIAFAGKIILWSKAVATEL